MALPAQAKVLRVLQSGELSRVGGEQTLKVDVRVLAATNQDLTAAVAAGRFREESLLSPGGGAAQGSPVA